MKVLFCDNTFPAAFETLKKLLPDYEIDCCRKEELETQLNGVDVAIPLMARLDCDLVSQSRLRLIQQYGVGLEGVDLKAATRRGVFVANVPGNISSNSKSVAELVLWYMITLVRRLDESRICFRQKKLGEPLGDILHGKTAGIVGLGNLGKAIIPLLQALGMNILGIRKHPERKDDIESLRLDILGGPGDLEMLLSNSDFLILCLPLCAETKGLIDKKAVALMKRGVFLVNVSRGAIIEYESLLWGLSEGRIAGMGSDVFWTEPMPPEDPIFQYNVVATPHIGGLTATSYRDIGKRVAENLCRLEQGLSLLNCVNLNELSGDPVESETGEFQTKS